MFANLGIVERILVLGSHEGGNTLSLFPYLVPYGQEVPCQFHPSSVKTPSMLMKRVSLFVLLLSLYVTSYGQSATEKTQTTKPIFHINGVFPNLTVLGGNTQRSESGIGALLPWADKLWMIGYVAHIQGTRIGLYEIKDDMTMNKHPESITGTFANRMVHKETETGIIGPHFIDSEGNVRTCKELGKHRLAATMEHLTDPKNKVLFLTMEGLLFECDVKTLEVKQLFDLVKELKLPPTTYVHFKSGFTGNGRVVVANNSYNEKDYLGEHKSGRLAEWDGKKWTILEETAFVEVSGKMGFSYQGKSIYGNPIFATGWDNKSVILKNYNDRTNKWRTYRLPKGSQSFDHEWNTEWMRIREAQTERFLMDIHGNFYELPMMTYGGEVWGIKPIGYHLRIVPDYCFWRGLFVMAGDQTDHGVGQPQSGLLFSNIDDLWKMGKPQGWGSVWRDDQVKAGEISDPFLMTGFDKKTVHLKHDAATPVEFTLEIDFLGNNTWSAYKTIKVGANGYENFVFPDGFSAHWIRVKTNAACKATAHFVYN